jgi:hypothetical protein
VTSDPAQGARPLDPGLLQVIRSSAARLFHVRDAFIRQLRFDIMTMIPDLPADSWAFSERMVHAVLWAATTDQAPGEIASALRWVGARNRLEGFPEAQYVSVAHALVRTVHVLSENDWSTSTGSAWISYFLWMKPHLMAGAQEAATQQAAAQAQEAAWRETQRASWGSWDQAAAMTDRGGDVDLESVASLLDDEDDEDPGYGQIMGSMTLNQRREQPRNSD